MKRANRTGRCEYGELDLDTIINNLVQAELKRNKAKKLVPNSSRQSEKI